ncbi:MAG: response regulator [Candidatus Cloacimonetes bacterium]|nr:response regulator [Candidatus Cloacimonadota bacterium]
MKILIVDDQNDNLYLMQSLLQSQGYELILAHNGQEALDELSTNVIDLIISDILMPVMDGFTLCREVRKSPAYSHIPIIIYTATYTGEQDCELATRIGADDFIVKPCEPEILLKRIQDVIEGPRTDRESSSHSNDNEQEILKLYNERLVRKLEQKMQEMENEVAERMQAIEALRRSEELLKGAQAMGKMGGWEYNAVTEEMYWTQEMYHLYDIDPDSHEAQELVDSSLQCYPPESREKLQSLMEEMYAHGTAYELESWLTTFKGRKIYVRATAQGTMENGKLVKALGIIQDITESKRAQIKQQELSEQLRQAQKLDSIGQLAGGVAHDFNNVLTVILGYAEELLNNLRPQDPIYDDLQEILNAGNRASSLTRQLLTFSRKQIIQPQLVSINDAVNNLYKMLMRLIGEDVDFEIDLQEDIPPIMADIGQLEQVVMNLVINAREAMPMGGKLSIKTFGFEVNHMFHDQHPMIPPGEYVVLKITDTGTGMTKEIKEHIFEPFFTTKERGHGTGLGLPTVYGIVKQAEGHIHVDTLPGRGASFVILIPSAKGEYIYKAKPEDLSDKKGAKELILVVEDDPSIADLAGKIIHKIGYEVSSADSADRAMVMIENEGLRPRLVISDVVMPGLSGLELAAILRFKHPEIKILLMSGYTENVITKHGELDPNLPFIQKPFTRAELADKIRATLEAE